MRSFNVNILIDVREAGSRRKLIDNEESSMKFKGMLPRST